MEKKLLERLTRVIKNEVKQLAKEYKKHNGNSSLRIPNKDMNLWLVKEILNIRTDIAVLKMRHKLLMWFFSVTIALLAVFQII